jgi:hypothetical protein
MVLDIRFKNGIARQIQNIRRISVYLEQDGSSEPELIVYRYREPKEHIALSTVRDYWITND